MNITFTAIPFQILNVFQLYDILQLREEVFIIEQNCIYKDIDNYDKKSLHLLGYNDENILVAYARILPPNLKYKDASIGRVVTKLSNRNLGLGRKLMNEAINTIKTNHENSDITISAQYHLHAFYESLGFNRVGEIYDEDGIPHIEMKFKAK